MPLDLGITSIVNIFSIVVSKGGVFAYVSF